MKILMKILCVWRVAALGNGNLTFFSIAAQRRGGKKIQEDEIFFEHGNKRFPIVLMNVAQWLIVRLQTMTAPAAKMLLVLPTNSIFSGGIGL
ncbi:MAG: hypothetical protein JNJ94_09740 [Chlorobi bacterium]|nr:hypothetical protein [Chlorobiota bacterium]